MNLPRLRGKKKTAGWGRWFCAPILSYYPNGGFEKSEPPFLCACRPMTTCRDTVADWRLFCRVSFAFSKLTWSTSVKKSIAPPPGKYNIASALSFHVIQYNNGCSWRASFPSRKSGVFCCHFFGDDPVVCRCRSPPPFDSPVNHPWIEMEVHNEEN